MKILDILKLTPAVIGKMSAADLRKATKSLVDAANKRVKRLNRAGLSNVSAAAEHANREGKFTTKGKDLNALRQEYKRASNFLKAETGNIRGTRRALEKTRAKMEDILGEDLTGGQASTIIQGYSKLEQLSGRVSDQKFKYELFKQLNNRIAEGLTPEEAAEDINGKLSGIYEEYKQREEEQQNTTVSSFFE